MRIYFSWCRLFVPCGYTLWRDVGFGGRSAGGYKLLEPSHSRASPLFTTLEGNREHSLALGSPSRRRAVSELSTLEEMLILLFCFNESVVLLEPAWVGTALGTCLLGLPKVYLYIYIHIVGSI